MKYLEDIDNYLNKIDSQEVVEEDAADLEWTKRDYALNLLIRAGQLVKFMALPTPKFIMQKQIEILRERIDSIERMIEDNG